VTNSSVIENRPEVIPAFHLTGYTIWFEAADSQLKGVLFELAHLGDETIVFRTIEGASTRAQELCETKMATLAWVADADGNVVARFNNEAEEVRVQALIGAYEAEEADAQWGRLELAAATCGID
jgi:hypothetical protein